MGLLPSIPQAQTASTDRNLVVSAASQSAHPNATPNPAKAQRIALVIGNGDYKNAPLSNPVNDARAIVQALKESGFTVIVRENASQQALLSALREFGDKLRGGGVGLFYYAGHGMQIKGRNYLIPVGAAIEREDEVAYAAVDAQAVLDKMEAAGNGTNIMILDACRNNPFTRSFRSGNAGLATMDAPVGTLVAFSTSPGAVASDGAGQNGLYTQHLLTAMRQSGYKLEEVFKQVRTHVRRDSQGKQVPWEATSLEGDFYFTGGTALPTPGVTASVPLPALPSAAPSGAQPALAVVIPSPATKPSKIPSRNALGIAVGDRWRYQVVDKYKGEVVRNYVWKVDRIWPNGELSVNGGTQVNTPDNTLKTWKNTTWVKRGTEDGYHQYPKDPKNLRAGYKEPFQFKETALGADGNGWVQDWEGTMVVKGKERIKVPAGEFDAWRIERTATVNGKRTRGTGSAAWYAHNTMTLWYVPEIHSLVAREEEHRLNGQSAPDRNRVELTSYEVSSDRMAKN